MKVLSIDLDYIMGPTIELYNGLFFDQNASTRWRNLFERSDFRENHIFIDQSNLMFCYNAFLKSLKHCKDVSFGYDHDSILYKISDFSDIELINIDHHDDVFAADYRDDYYEFLEKEYSEIIESNKVHEGNWVAWLANKDKIKSYTWIGNKNSANKIRNDFNSKIVPNYLNIEKENYKFDNYNFDHIFVCLSPQYIPKNHWHYFSMFISAFEEFTEKSANIISWATKKYEIELRHSKVTDEILHQCSNGR